MIAAPVDAIDPALSAAVPADALAVVLLDVDHDAPRPPSAVDVAAGAVRRARDMGLLSGLGVRNSLILDAFSEIPRLTARHPIALVLHDAHATSLDGGGHKLADIQVSLLLRTGGATDGVTGLVQRFLTRYTNSDVSRIHERKRGSFVRYTLTDSRLPEWADVDWGGVDDYYVISLGKGAFDKAAGAIEGGRARLNSDTWFVECEETLDTASALAAWYVDFDGLKCALGPGLGGLEQEVAHAVAQPGVDRSMWAVGVHDRGLRFEYYQAIDERSRLYRVATPATRADLGAGMIPSRATWYALIGWDPTAAVTGYATAYVASHDAKTQQRLRSYWSEIEQSLGVSVERDLLFQLSNRVLAHNDPQHPLIPGCMSTLQFEIVGSATTVRSTLDKFLSRWRQELIGPLGGAILPTLHRGDDGVWFLQCGFYGPALAVHDRWLVVGTSPHAVRHNIARMSLQATALADDRPSP